MIGRPTIHAKKMSDAERQRRSRALRRESGTPTSMEIRIALGDAAAILINDEITSKAVQILSSVKGLDKKKSAQAIEAWVTKKQTEGIVSPK